MADLPLADVLADASNTTTHQPHIPPIGLKLPSAEPTKQSALPQQTDEKKRRLSERQLLSSVN